MTEQIKCVNILLDTQTQIDRVPYFKTLDKIFDNIEDIVISVDSNNKIININLAAEKMIQTSKDSILGLNINNLIEKLGLINYKIIQDGDLKIYIIKKSNDTLCYSQVQDKECFLYNVSHEIKTPLNGIIGMTQILKNKVDDNLKEYIEIISTCGYQLMDILDDILDYAKITSGGICLKPTNFNLRKCLEEIHDIIIPKITNSKIDISYNIDANIPEYIYCEQKRLKQILLNLLSNSIKFTETGFIKTSVILENRDYNKLNLIFKVEDSGIGIPSSHFEKIFKPYIQVNNHLIHKYEGTGLGLSISLQLAKLLNGDIKVESELGVGSCFSLKIAVVEKEPTTPMSIDERNSSVGSSSISCDSGSCNKRISNESLLSECSSEKELKELRELYNMSKNNIENGFVNDCEQTIQTLKNVYINKKCLVIDDNCNNRIMLCNLLSELGISPIMASCFEEVCLIKKTFHFDLIFLNMTNNLNIEMIIENMNIPIIGITSIDNALILKENSKFNDILIKPIKKHNLCKILSKFF